VRRYTCSWGWNRDATTRRRELAKNLLAFLRVNHRTG
jgi:hypothetical protein